MVVRVSVALLDRERIPVESSSRQLSRPFLVIDSALRVAGVYAFFLQGAVRATHCKARPSLFASRFGVCLSATGDVVRASRSEELRDADFRYQLIMSRFRPTSVARTS